MTVEYIVGDSYESLCKLPSDSVQCVVTSPPYYGLRDYGMDGQIGHEKTPEEFIESLVNVFREVKRVLRDDGTLWLNIGDTYAASYKGDKTGGGSDKQRTNKGVKFDPKPIDLKSSNIKTKDLIGIPWMLAFALRNDGWYLRQDIIWNKPNCMPESVTDRCTKAHEYVFLLSKNSKYYFDSESIKEDARYANSKVSSVKKGGFKGKNLLTNQPSFRAITETRNKRSVWNITKPCFSGAHFATMPPDMAEICILAGSKPGDIVLDPFGGAGTTGLVADRLDRNAILIDLNLEYIEISRKRIEEDRLNRRSSLSFEETTQENV